MGQIEYRRATDRDEVERFVQIAARSLFFQRPADDWIDDEGLDNFRVVTDDGELVGGLVWQPIGQYVGGRSVPCGALRAVAIRPDARAGGIGGSMMKANLRELREQGFPLASLYASTQKIYRGAGYEMAGSRLTWSLSLAKLEVRDRELSIRQGGPEDLALLRDLYEGSAFEQTGQLDRSDWIWRRVLGLRDAEAGPYDIWIFEGDDGPEGYAVVTVRGNWGDVKPPRLVVTDRVTLTGRAMRRLLTLFGDHRSIVEEVQFAGGPSEPLLHHLPQRAFQDTRTAPWMDRIVDVGAALERRGWAPGRAGVLEIGVRDDVLAENDGSWILEVDDGRAVARRGGRGALRIDIRGLASLYTGFASAEHLAAAGLAEGSDADLALASSLFAGPAPWMSDAF